MGLKTEYFHPFALYAACRAWTADSSPFFVYQRDKLLGEYRDRLMGGGLDLGLYIGRGGTAVGYEAGYRKVNEDLGIPVAPAVHGRSE